MPTDMTARGPIPADLVDAIVGSIDWNPTVIGGTTQEQALVRLIIEGYRRRTSATDVDGYCPMGCGRTLFLGDGGCITCSYVSCPDRQAVDTILSDSESEHVVQFRRPDTFVIRHPLRERVGDELTRCALHAHVESFSGPPTAPGKYRTSAAGEGWRWERLDGAEA